MATLNSAPMVSRRGLTLVEMLVSLVCVILLMLAYTQLFGEAGTRINDARASIDMTNRLRSAAHRLRTDLAGVTVETIPWQRPESGAGYFELIEGPSRDYPVLDDPLTLAYDESSTTFPLGDTDDVLMFTVRSKDGPFIGRYTDPGTGATSTVQSEVAEVIWFLRPSVQPDPAAPGVARLISDPPTYTLYRRVFLVMPTYRGNPVRIPLPLSSPFPPGKEFDELFDLSAYVEGSFAVGNTLADLTKRENRFGHGTNFPHAIDPTDFVPFGGQIAPGGGGDPELTVNTDNSRYGEDVVLTNVLAFDVQVWDPTARVKSDSTNSVALVPSDPGYLAGNDIPAPPAPDSTPRFLEGAYVDIGWRPEPWDIGEFPPYSPLGTLGHPKSKLHHLGYATYDTWSFHYEHDGIDQDGDSEIDLGTDGFDNDGTFGVDDTGGLDSSGRIVSFGERETSPPYPVPLRGVKVRIRVYEPDSRQIREVSVVHSFVPE